MASKVLGAFAEYVLLPEHVVKQNAFRKPSGLSFDEAAMLEPLACVVHPYAMLDFSKISTAVVIGAGPIGLLHITHLKMKGVHTIAADLNMQRLEVAGLLGADASCMPDALRDIVDRETSGMGVDLVVECTGQTDVWQESVLYTRRGGTVVLFGGCKSGTSATFDTHRLHYDEITLTGSFHFSPCDVKEAYRLLAGGTITVTPLISGVMNLTDIGTAFEKLKEGTGIKYAIRP
jgi:L-iditol 2-dehydrogenase